jgi:archaellin
MRGAKGITGGFDILLYHDPSTDPTWALANYTYAPALLVRNEWFKVEIAPTGGAMLIIERYMPASIDKVVDLG